MRFKRKNKRILHQIKAYHKQKNTAVRYGPAVFFCSTIFPPIVANIPKYCIYFYSGALANQQVCFFYDIGKRKMYMERAPPDQSKPRKSG